MESGLDECVDIMADSLLCVSQRAGIRNLSLVVHLVYEDREGVHVESHRYIPTHPCRAGVVASNLLNRETDVIRAVGGEVQEEEKDAFLP